MDVLEYADACEVLHAHQQRIKELNALIDEERTSSAFPMNVLFDMMKAAGQRSKRIPPYTVLLEYSEETFCKCHGTSAFKCPQRASAGVTIQTRPRVYVRKDKDR